MVVVVVVLALLVVDGIVGRRRIIMWMCYDNIDCQILQLMIIAFINSVLSPSSQNSVWLCLGVIAMFSVITIILCVRLAKHLRRAKTGSEDVFSDEGTSNYGVPLRLFDKFPKVDKKKFTVPW